MRIHHWQVWHRERIHGASSTGKCEKRNKYREIHPASNGVSLSPAITLHYKEFLLPAMKEVGDSSAKEIILLRAAIFRYHARCPLKLEEFSRKATRASGTNLLDTVIR
jgi:hypothetical protein